MSTPQIIQISPSELTLHPFVALTPEWSSDDARFLQMVDDIRDRGIDQPILIDSEKRILDGRHRWRAAKRLQLETIPAIQHSADEAASIASASLYSRRHLTKGQMAFALVPLIPQAFKEAVARKENNLKRGSSLPKPIRSLSGVKTPEEWANEKGFSLDILMQAKELHELFKDSKKRYIRNVEGEKLYKSEVTFKDYFLPLIMAAEPIGLGAAKSAIKSILAQEHQESLGKPHKGGRPKEKQRQIELFQEAFHTLSKRFEYWDNFKDVDKQECLEPLRETLADMPEDMLNEFSSAVRSELRRRTKHVSVEVERE